jgi:hypothetical protein
MLLVLFLGLSMLHYIFSFLLQELLKRVRKESVNDRRAPRGGNGRGSGVLKMETVRTISEAPAGGSAVVLDGDAEPSTAMEEDMPPPLENTDDMPGAEEAAP